MTDAAEAIPNRGYHAHIYYDPQKTRPTAERLCAVIGDKFQVQFGGFRDEPIGPHPVANAQVIFKPEQFQPVVEWLMLHRDGLDVLIHPLTDDSVDDHSIYAMWLGSPVPLKLNTLRRSYRAELLPSVGARSHQACKVEIPHARLPRIRYYLQGLSCLHAMIRQVWPTSPPSQPGKGQSATILGSTTTSMNRSKRGMVSKFSNL